MKKRIIALLTATMIVGGLLSACSSSPKDTDTNPPVSSDVQGSPEPSSTPEPSPSTEPSPDLPAEPSSSPDPGESTSPSSNPTLEPSKGPDASQKPSDKPVEPSKKPTATPKPTKEPTATKAPTPTKKPAETPKPTKQPEPTKKPEPTKQPEPTKKPEPSVEPTLSASDIVKNMLEKVEQPHLSEIGDEQLMDLYGIDASILADYTVRMPLINVKTNEIAVFKVKKDSDIDTVKKGIKSRAEAVQKQFEHYLPDQYENAKNYKIVTKGNYVLFLISDKADELEKEFLNNLK